MMLLDNWWLDDKSLMYDGPLLLLRTWLVIRLLLKMPLNVLCLFLWLVKGHGWATTCHTNVSRAIMCRLREDWGCCASCSSSCLLNILFANLLLIGIFRSQLCLNKEILVTMTLYQFACALRSFIYRYGSLNLLYLLDRPLVNINGCVLHPSSPLTRIEVNMFKFIIQRSILVQTI